MAKPQARSKTPRRGGLPPTWRIWLGTGLLLVAAALVWGCAVAVVPWQNPLELVLILLPVAAVVLLYHAYSRERGRRESAERLKSEPGTYGVTASRQQLRGDMERAVKRGQFVSHYQPVVDLRDGRIVGVEALLRWRHPERGLIGPDEFVPIAEESGLIVPLGEFVLREACSQVSTWQRLYPGVSDFFVSVNISARQLQQELFVETVMNCLGSTGAKPTSLVLELTESMLFEPSSPLLGKLEALRRQGIRIAIDDYGTGYSSLSYLRNLPVDILKVAKPFVDDLAEDAARGDFARVIVTLGHSLGLEMVAEGIEKPIQASQLGLMGCTLGQGFLYCHPVGPAEIGELLERGGFIPERGDEGVKRGQVISLR